MITIKRTFPKYEKHSFENVSELTKWAMDYAEKKGCDLDAYVRAAYNDDEELVNIIDDKDYTLEKLFYDGWVEIKEEGTLKFGTINIDGEERDWEFEDISAMMDNWYSDECTLPANDDPVTYAEYNGEIIDAEVFEDIINMFKN